VGTITRGTTNPNRLRRCDRWLTGPQAWRLRQTSDPLVVDLGYGHWPYTTVELRDRLAAVRSDVTVIGLEIDPDRVTAAQPWADTGLSFAHGGFEVPTPAGRRPIVVRAFNVLRQYPEIEVEATWSRVRARLAPNGLLVDGTCDELGRRATWVAVTSAGPVSLTLSARLADLGRPSEIASRLPKSLIHHNLPDEPIGRFLRALDAAWEHQVGFSAFGARQRWMAMAAAVKAQGWPLLDGPARHRLGELTVAWSAVHPTPPW
jgi:hypothetical protein